MKNTFLLNLALFFSVLSSSAQGISGSQNDVMKEDQSRYHFAATVDSISKAAVSKGWKVTMVHDLQETMRKNGKEVKPVKVMEICNPGLAYQILSRDDLRDVSAMLPCRISVYEKADGLTYVSRMNAPSFAGMFEPEAAETIRQAFNEAEGFIKSVVY